VEPTNNRRSCKKKKKSLRVNLLTGLRLGKFGGQKREVKKGVGRGPKAKTSQKGDGKNSSQNLGWVNTNLTWGEKKKYD